MNREEAGETLPLSSQRWLIHNPWFSGHAWKMKAGFHHDCRAAVPVPEGHSTIAQRFNVVETSGYSQMSVRDGVHGHFGDAVVGVDFQSTFSFGNPGGMIDNSPAVSTPGTRDITNVSPEGTAEGFALWPSVRDVLLSPCGPGVETPGCSRPSLRDQTAFYRNLRIGFSLALGLFCHALALAAPDVVSNSNSQTQPLNVIILLADDMGWGDLGCQRHPYIKTPAIDKLAAKGCLFDQFYVTAPVCSPSRAGLMTGRIQNRFGMQHLIRDVGPLPIFHHVPVEEPALPRLLKNAGYATAHVGKWHLSFAGREGEPTPKEYGYDHSLTLGATRNGSYRDSQWMRNGERVTTQGRWTSEIYIDEAIQFIEQAGQKPFFINLWSFAPHQEVDCAPQYRAFYGDRTESEQYYCGTVTQMDEQYGRLFDYLDKKDLWQTTIVIFTSDNGPEPHLIPWSERARGSTGGLRGGKHHLYEGGIRVPGIIYWPGVTRPGSISHEICWTPDLLATLCAAVGVPVPKDFPFDGIDLRPALRGEKLVRCEPLYWQFPFGVGLRDGVHAHSPGLALREGAWKLHCDLKFEQVELYNLDIDRNEKWNMQAVYPEITSRLLDKMRQIHADVNGPYSKNAHFLNPKIPIPPSTKGKTSKND
jgi:arylsulfatase A